VSSGTPTAVGFTPIAVTAYSDRAHIETPVGKNPSKVSVTNLFVVKRGHQGFTLAVIKTDKRIVKRTQRASDSLSVVQVVQFGYEVHDPRLKAVSLS